jgi:hypothetical protein
MPSGLSNHPRTIVKSSFIFTTICSMTCIFPCYLAIKKFNRVNVKYKPFLLYLIFSALIEISARVLLVIRYNSLSNFVLNSFVLYEGLIFIYLFYLWEVINKKSILYIIYFLFITIWVFDNFFFNSILYVNSFYVIFYSIFVVLLSISLFITTTSGSSNYYTLDPLSIISGVFIINYSYRAVFESTYLFKNIFSNDFYFKAFLIFIILNLLSNCIYTYALYLMDMRKRLMQHY